MIVGHTKYNVQHSGLYGCEVQETCQQCRPHFGYRDTHRMTKLAEDVPKACWEAPKFKFLFQSELQNPVMHRTGIASRQAHPGEIPFDIC